MSIPKFQYCSVACAEDTFRYRLYLPECIDSNTRYPLVLFLHGGSGRGDDNEGQMKNGEAAQWADWVESKRIEPCIIAAPQQPAKYGFFMESDCVRCVTQDIATEHPVDMDRIYLTGISMGGMGCWSETAKYPGLFTAFLSAAGVYPDSRYDFPVGKIAPAFPDDVIQIPVSEDEFACAINGYAQALRKTPIRHIHSASDTMAPVNTARRMADTMAQYHATAFQYIEYPETLGISHSDTYQAVLDDFENITWLLRQHRAKEETQ